MSSLKSSPTPRDLPEHIIKQIIEYIPNDKDMKSPTSICLKHMINYYYNNDIYAAGRIKITYLLRINEPFYIYVLRINRSKRQELRSLIDSDAEGDDEDSHSQSQEETDSQSDTTDESLENFIYEYENIDRSFYYD